MRKLAMLGATILILTGARSLCAEFKVNNKSPISNLVNVEVK